MFRQISLVVLALVSLALFGCPYESKIPISGSYKQVDKNLLGTWESDDEVYNTYIISPSGNYKYNIQQRTLDGQSYNFTGYISEVRGATFLNAYSDSEKVYYLYRLKIDSTAKTVIVMPFAKDMPYKFTDTTELKNLVWRSMNLREFYDIEDQVVYRLVSPERKSFN